MPEWQLRMAEGRDLPAINEIYNHYVLTATCTYALEPETAAEREAWFAQHGERYPVLVTESDGQILGWASLSPFRTRPGYRFTVENSVYIRAGCHGQGIGKGLMRALIERARELGYRTIIAGVSADQEASMALHKSLGFELVGHFREVGFKFDRWLDVVWLQLILH